MLDLADNAVLLVCDLPHSAEMVWNGRGLEEVVVRVRHRDETFLREHGEIITDPKKTADEVADVGLVLRQERKDVVAVGVLDHLLLRLLHRAASVVLLIIGALVVLGAQRLVEVSRGGRVDGEAGGVLVVLDLVDIDRVVEREKALREVPVLVNRGLHVNRMHVRRKNGGRRGVHRGLWMRESTAYWSPEMCGVAR